MPGADAAAAGLQPDEASPAASAAPGSYTAGMAAVLRTLTRSRANQQLLHPQEWARYEAALASQR